MQLEVLCAEMAVGAQMLYFRTSACASAWKHASLSALWTSAALFIMLPWLICQHGQTCDFCMLLEGSALTIYLLMTTFAVFPSRCCYQDPMLILWCSHISISLPFPCLAGSIIKALHSYPWRGPRVEAIGDSHRPHGSLKWPPVTLIFFMCHQGRCRMGLIKIRGSEKGRNWFFFLPKGRCQQQLIMPGVRRKREMRNSRQLKIIC